MKPKNVAELIVECLENEGVEYVFGLPGEENIRFVNAVHNSDKIRFILVRHEQGASFMADVYGRLTGKAGVCASTLGPGAINLLLGVTDAFTDSVPVVAIAAQVGLNRIYKETHQYVDLLSLFKPVTKWSNVLYTPKAVPETIRKVFNIAETERPGATFLAIPEDLEGMEVSDTLIPLSKKPVYKAFPDIILVNKAIEILKAAKNPVMLIGYGAVRGKAEKEIRDLCKQLNIPTATTYMAKGVVSDREENVMGTIGFM